jgi:hypothetical protein
MHAVNKENIIKGILNGSEDQADTLPLEARALQPTSS